MPVTKTLARASDEDGEFARGNSAIDGATAALSSRIVSGRFDAGERLTEARLATELNVSRGTVRQTLQRLANEGLLELLPNRGAVVRRLTRQDMADLFQLRALYESFAARRAAERINEPGCRDVIAGLISEIEDLSRGDHAAGFLAHDGRLHTTILELSGNKLLLNEWRRNRSPLFRQKYFAQLRPVDVSRSLEQHLAILTAILVGDGAGAERVATAHIQGTYLHVQKMSDKEFDAFFNFAR